MRSGVRPGAAPGEGARARAGGRTRGRATAGPGILRGPRSPDPADLAACRAILRESSHSFSAAARLLPPSVARAATVLYAFCRIADDEIDLAGGRAAAIRALATRLGDVYAGRPGDHPADRALAALLTRRPIPRALFDALLEGLAWDAEGRRYEDLASLHAYAARVAGTVGAMMALAMGVRSPRLLARACDLGVAMQLTNVARDVGEDANAGRIYLPLDWLRGAGLDPEAWLREPRDCSAVRSATRRLLAEAGTLYAQADAGIAGLPPACRPGIAAARLLYADIGRAIRDRGHDAVTGRAYVAWPRRLRLIATALFFSPHRAPAPPRRALPATDFLIAASIPDIRRLRATQTTDSRANVGIDHGSATAGAQTRGARRGTRSAEVGEASADARRVSPRGLTGRIVWVLELFERLERREYPALAERGATE